MANLRFYFILSFLSALIGATSAAGEVLNFYDKPNPKIDSKCDVYLRVEFDKNVTPNKVVLSDRLSAKSTCKLFLVPLARTFKVKNFVGKCGEKIYQGVHYKENGAGIVIKLTDYREETCNKPRAAKVVLQEKIDRITAYYYLR
jgi:hypothetical protein